MLSSGFEGGKDGSLLKAKNSPKVRDLQRKLYQKAKQRCESLWKKMSGKPYSGKLNVRFTMWSKIER